MIQFPVFPPHMKQAADRQKGQNWFIELLIFFLVYMISSMAASVIVVVGSVAAVLSDSTILKQFASGDVRQAETLMNSLLDSDPIMIVTLFANAAMILITVLFCIFLQKRTAVSMGFVRKKAFTQYLAGAGIGLLLFCGAVLINVLTGSMTISGISSGFSPVLFLLFLLGFGVQGLGEEVLCRGYFMVSLGRRYRAAAAVFLNSAVFSLLHIFNPGLSLLAIINLLLAGVVFSLYFLRTGNIWGAGAMHTVWNFVQGNVFGMEVSGLNLSCSLFESSTDPARSFWNGGAFGPEGGFSVTIVMVIAILLLLFWKKPENEAQGTAQIPQPADPQHTTQQIQDSQHVEMR